MGNPIAVPGMKGIRGAFGDFAFGAIGGLIFLIALKIFGPLGALAAPLIAGAMIKGNRGEIIATMAGFMLLAAGGLAASGGGDSGTNGEVI